MRSKFFSLSTLLASIFFFGLVIYNAVTGAFVGSDEDFGSGFSLAAILFGTISVALRSESKFFKLVALTAPIWGPYPSSFICLCGGGSVGYGPDFLFWPWAMLLFIPLVGFIGLVTGQVSLMDTVSWGIPAIIPLPLILLYIYAYITIAIRFFFQLTKISKVG